jgi:hypothetical protein
MDQRKLDTLTMLSNGIISLPAPETDIPENRVSVDPRDGESAHDALETGKLLDVAEYYGCVYAWKDETGYHGRLLQYRKLTEHHDFATADVCLDWFQGTVEHVS